MLYKEATLLVGRQEKIARFAAIAFFARALSIYRDTRSRVFFSRSMPTASNTHIRAVFQGGVGSVPVEKISERPAERAPSRLALTKEITRAQQ